MATAGNTRQQSKFQQEPESSENDYMTDDYEFSGDDEYDHENESEPEPQRMRQRQVSLGGRGVAMLVVDSREFRSVARLSRVALPDSAR